MYMLIESIAAVLPQLLRLIFSLHVGGGHSFPKPLTAKEERQCLMRARNGDASARSELIEHNLRLVVHIINNE